MSRRVEGLRASFVALAPLVVAALAVPSHAQAPPAAHLSSGSGDGFAVFRVGPFGESEWSWVGSWDAPDANGPTNTQYFSFLVISDRAVASTPTGHTLYRSDWTDGSTYHKIDPTAAQLQVVSTTASTMHSTFVLPAFPGVAVDLVQSAVVNKLTRTYTFTNTGQTDYTLTLAFFNDVDIELGPNGGNNWRTNLAFYRPHRDPNHWYITDAEARYFGVLGLEGEVQIQGARIQYRPNNEGGGNHERVKVSNYLGHPVERLIFDECVDGRYLDDYADCGSATSDDLDGDGRIDVTADPGGTIQGVLTLPAGQTRVVLTTEEYLLVQPAEHQHRLLPGATQPPACPGTASGTIAVELLDGSGCTGTSDLTATPVPGSGPGGTTPPAVSPLSGVSAGTHTFALAGSGAYLVSAIQTGSCLPKDDPVTLTVNVGSASDITPPILTCPAPIDVSTGPGVCHAVVDYEVTASDNCEVQEPIQVMGLPSGASFPIGTTSNTFNVMDGSWNSGACGFGVTVHDATAPLCNDPGEGYFHVSIDTSTGSAFAVCWFEGLAPSGGPGSLDCLKEPNGSLALFDGQPFCRGNTP